MQFIINFNKSSYFVGMSDSKSWGLNISRNVQINHITLLVEFGIQQVYLELLP